MVDVEGFVGGFWIRIRIGVFGGMACVRGLWMRWWGWGDVDDGHLVRGLINAARCVRWM